jgi:hypothetical protein
LTPTNIMPNVFQDNVAQVVAQSVMKAI